MEKFIIPLLKPLGKYLECLKLTDDSLFYITEGLKQKESKLLLGDVFIPLQITGEHIKIPPGFNYDSNTHEEIEAKINVDIWTLLKEAQQNPVYYSLIITAKGGLGKTTLLKHLTYIYANKKYRSYQAPQLIPVLLYLRRWQKEIATGNKPDLPTLIEDYYIPSLPGGRDLEFPENWAKNHLRNGKMLILLDGFDEVKKEWRNPLSEWIGESIKNYPQSFFILTSRPHGYRDYQASIEPKSRLYVKPFNDEQKERFIKRWYHCREKNIHVQIKSNPRIIEAKGNQKADNLIQQIKERPELNNLARNPLMLNIMVSLHCLYQSRNLPKRRSELYKEIVLLQLGDRPLAREIELVLETEVAQKVLQGLALSMLMEQKRQIEDEYLIEKIKTQFDRYNIESSVKPEAFLEQLEKVSELVVKIDDYYEFAHLSFQEYLAAVEIKETEQENLLINNWQNSWWRETILLYSALINPNNFLRQLIKIRRRDAVTLALRCIEETPRKIDAQVKQGLNIDDAQVETELKSIKTKVSDLLFKKLEEYLKNRQWKEADEETERLMIQIGDKDEKGYLSLDNIENFPCEELRTINDLWVNNSEGKFGFTVQKQIWLDCGGKIGEYEYEPYLKFAEKVKWYNREKTNWYEEITYELNSETATGHLPWLCWDLKWKKWLDSRGLRELSFLAQRLVNCRI